MLQQIIDLEAEGKALFGTLSKRPDADFARVTAFKEWTIADVLRHLHIGDTMAELSVTDPDAFQRFLGDTRSKRAAGISPRDDARARFGYLDGQVLLNAWHAKLDSLIARLAAKSPDARLKWAGPDMGVRMFATARQMEIWAHGQEVYDVLGLERTATDRLRNIAEIGVRTFGWTFVNRGLQAPTDLPHVRLTAPSGDIWEWNPASNSDRVEGSALEFAQVVTQVRNIADTRLVVAGGTAQAWMAIAQCFAGPPETPPAPGTRRAVS